VSDVVLLDTKAETGASNYRRFAAIICSKTPRFEEVVGLLDHVMRMLEVKKDKALSLSPDARAYSLQPTLDPAFFGELGAADIVFRGVRVGVCGVVHPEVLANYNIKYPCSAIELALHSFL
jgi:phenylalanyl-tRNA synthetase beta chain